MLSPLLAFAQEAPPGALPLERLADLLAMASAEHECNVLPTPPHIDRQAQPALMQCIWRSFEQGQVLQLRDQAGTLHWIDYAGNYRTVQEAHNEFDGLRSKLEPLLGPAQEQQGHCRFWASTDYVVVATVLIFAQSEGAPLGRVRLIGSDTLTAVSC